MVQENYPQTFNMDKESGLEKNKTLSFAKTTSAAVLLNGSFARYQNIQFHLPWNQHGFLRMLATFFVIICL